MTPPKLDAIELAELDALGLAAQIRSGALSAEQLAQQCLAKADADAERLGAFVWLDHQQVLSQARRIDQKRKDGAELGRLAGVPVAIKDAIVTHDGPTTAASRILRRRPDDPTTGYRSVFDATVIERLRAEDAVLFGKTNMDEFAMGSSNENSAFFPAKNPHDEQRTPGGSSGGSAVAVAAGITPLSLGSDTGGSIRQPAALTGTVGVKPTYGRVSRYGLIAFASSLDQIGTFAANVRGAAESLAVIAGHDPRDATSLLGTTDDWTSAVDAGVAGLRLGIPKEYFADGVEPGVRKRVEQAIERLEKAGASLHEVSLPTTAHAVATYYVIATAEASSNLARFDGIRFGLRAAGDTDGAAGLSRRTRCEGFGDEVKRRILLGTFVLSSGYYDAYYLRAQQVRALIAQDFARVFEQVDALVTPTSPTVAFRLGERTSDPLSMYLADVCTLPASLAGLPAISVPCGKAAALDAPADARELPVGLQIMGKPLDETTIFRVAGAAERSLIA